MSDERVSREQFADIASDTLDRVQEATPWPPIDPPEEFQRLWDDAMDFLDKAEAKLQTIVGILEEEGDA